MGLDIQGSNIGYDQNNLQSLIERIQTELIIDSLNKILDGITILEDNMPNYWVGDSAEAFRSKLEVDSSKLAQQFQSISRALESEIKQMMANVVNSDAVVAASILGQGYDAPSTTTSLNTSVETNYATQDTYYSPYTSSNNYSPVEIDSAATSVNVDGDDNSSFLKNVGATLGTVGTGLLEGVGLFGEAVVDALVIKEAQELSPLLNAIDMGTLMYDIANGKEHNSVWNGVMNYVSDQNCKWMFDTFYDSGLSGCQKYCYGFDTTRGVSNGVGFTGSVILSAIGLGGPGALAAGGSGTTSALMAAVGGITGFGTGAERAWGDGASWQQGLNYAKASALWEGAQYYIGGEINGLSPFAKEGANSLLRIGLDAIDSGAEGLVRPALQTIYSDKSYGQLFQEAGGVGNVITQAAFGAGMSGVGEASGLARIFRKRNYAELANDSNVTNSIGDSIFIKQNEIKSEVSKFFDQFNNDMSSFGVDQGSTSRVTILGRKNNNWLLDEEDFSNYVRNFSVFKGAPESIINDAIYNLINRDTIVMKHMQDTVFNYISKNSLDSFTAKQTFMNSFDYIKADYYDDVVKIMTTKGLTEENAIDFIKKMDRRFGGVCSYASSCSEIICHFANNAEEFKKIFGYDMFRKNSNGSQVLNVQPLLVDLYVYCNTDVNIIRDGDFPSKTLFSDVDGKLFMNEDSGVEQFAISNLTCIRDDMINSFLQSKGANLSIKHTTITRNDTTLFNMPSLGLKYFGSQDYTVKSLYDEFKSIHDSGNYIRLGVSNEEKAVNFYNMDGSFYTNTHTWSEGGAHNVIITDVLEEGLEVSSWGEKLFIPYKDLISNSFSYSYGKFLSNNG